MLWKRFEPRYRAQIEAEMSQLQAKARDPVIVNVSNDDLIDEPLVKKFILEIIAQFDASARKALVQFGQVNADQWEVRNQAVYDQIRQHAIKLAQSTIQEMQVSTEEEVKRVLEEIRQEMLLGQTGGETLREKVDRIAKYFGEESRWRARRIAITESARGLNYGYLAGTAESEVVVGYEWLLSDDACDRCMAIGTVDGQPRRVKKGQPFAVGQSTDEYYATILAPPLHPNCRCTLVGVLDIDQPAEWDSTV